MKSGMSSRKAIHIGTSGWNYDHWRGPFYPKDLPQGAWLDFYAQQFHTVEINNSFYRLPEKSTFESWRDTVPEDFLFAVKGSRYITHMKKLKDPQESLARFVDRVRGLGAKLGPVLFQLPPRWRVNVERLEAFLGALPGDLRWAFEFRDTSWFGEATSELLRQYGAAFCIYQFAGTLSPREVTADFVYIRLHGPQQEAYRGQYDETTLREWAGAMRTWAEAGREVFCYFDNDEKGYAAQDALRLQELLGG